MTTARVLIAIGILALAGCAKVGTLDRPAPLFGERAKADYRAEKAREAQARAQKSDRGEPEALPPSAPAEANPPVTGGSEKINGQPETPPPSPELPPAAPQ